MMKNTNLLIISCLFFLALEANGEVRAKLEAMEGVEVETLDAGVKFKARYLLWIEQPLDHENPSLGVFKQRVVLSINDLNQVVVFNTEGYNLDDPSEICAIHELTELFRANQIDVEHRFFPPSAPEQHDWRHLNVSNAAADHHRIVSILKPLLGGVWIGTGISKGGQAAMFHRTYYPDDVDITVGYVCPLPFSQEDLRVNEFLRRVGDEACRGRVRGFQEMMLRERERMMPVFIKEAKRQDLNYRIGYEKAYEFIVLEYAFAFWQWGLHDCSAIPGREAKSKLLIAHLDSVASLDWVSDEFLKDNPFFYQAITEIGMYGYDTSGWQGLLKYIDDPSFRFTCPNGYTCTFDPSSNQKVDAFVRHQAERMVFLYGEYDPWSATAVQWSGNPGVRVFVKEGGSHLTRIANLPKVQREELVGLLFAWIAERDQGLR